MSCGQLPFRLLRRAAAGERLKDGARSCARRSRDLAAASARLRGVEAEEGGLLYTDNKEYRRAYKRWHSFKTRDQEYSAKRQRELDENSCLQSVLDAEPDQPRFKKPRGRAPLADGVPCTLSLIHI